MSNANIHPSAIVSPKAQIGEGVTIGPFAIIEDDVIIGNNNEIRSSAVIANGSRIGNDNVIGCFSVIGTEPQDIKYKGEATYVVIGDNNVIREYVTVHRASVPGGETKVGNNCLLMAYTHVAHDCKVGNNVIMSNLAQLAGHVVLEDWVILSGFAKIHQFCQIGCHSMVGGDVKVVKDVPPYTLIGRMPPKIEGINKIGLRRRGFSDETIKEIEDFYDLILFSDYNTTSGIEKFLERENVCDEVKYCIDFIRDSKRGIYR